MDSFSTRFRSKSGDFSAKSARKKLKIFDPSQRCGTWATTSSATGGKALGGATFWSVLGPIAWVTCYFSIWFCLFWSAVRNAPTLRARRFRVYSAFWTLQYIPLFIIALTFVGLGIATVLMLILQDFMLPGLLLLFSFIITFTLMFSCMYPIQQARTRKMKGIVENDLGLPGEHVESYSYQQVERRFFLSIITNVLLAITIFGSIAVMATLEGDCTCPTFHIVELCGIIIFALVLAVYYRLGRYFLEICRTKENFLAAPPVVVDPLETALGISGKIDVSIDHPNTKADRLVILLGMSVIIVCGIHYFSMYSWEKYPIPLGICALLIAASIVTFFWLCKRIGIKDYQKNPQRWDFVFSLFFPFGLALMYCMEYIEFGGIHFWEVWSGSSSLPENNGIRVMHRMMLLTMIILLPLFCFVRHKASDGKEHDKETLLREAISRFDPATMIADEPEACAKPFPRHWIWIIGLYAAAIVALWCVGVLFF